MSRTLATVDSHDPHAVMVALQAALDGSGPAILAHPGAPAVLSGTVPPSTGPTAPPATMPPAT
ncbi:MAG: hypothetical protein ACOH1K_07355, partial [Rhodoglobus sp.]